MEIDDIEPFLAFLAPTVEPKTLINYRGALEDLRRFLASRAPTPELISAWVVGLIAGDQAKAWIEVKVLTARRFFAWREKKGGSPSPFAGAVLPRIPRGPAKQSREPLSTAEFDAVTNLLHFRGRTVVRNFFIVGHETGLRLSDVALLRWSAVDWGEQLIVVTPRKTKRSGKTVCIPMTGPCLVAVKAQRATPYDERTKPTGDPKEFVFPSMAVKYSHSGRAVTVQMSRWLQKAGVKDRSFHALRHGFVSKLANADVPYKVITGLTGQHPRTIARYHHVATDTLRKAMLKLAD